MSYDYQLLDCPFCGNQPILDIHPPYPGEDDSFAVIRCPTCGISKQHDYPEVVVKWWNTRAK